MRTIVEPELLPDEVQTGFVKRMLRPGRIFTVHDPLAFNCILRELQRAWCATARGTKGMSEMLDIVGLGPPKGAHAHKVYLDKHRGPASTDPDKVHPDGPAEYSRTKRSRESDLSGKKETRETDGLYFRRYEYDAARAVKAATGRTSRVFKTRRASS